MNPHCTFNYSIAQTNKPYWVWGPLAFSGFYFLPFIVHHQLTVITAAVVITLYLGFIALYRQAVHAKGEQVIPWLIALLTLISLSTYFNSGSNALFGYCAFIASYNLSLKKSVFSLFVITSAILISGYFFAQSHPYFFSPALFISYGLWVLGQSTRKDAIHRIKEAKSQKTIEQLATTAERERIARDLHDLVGHSLSSIALKAELAEKYLSAEKQALAKHEINEVAKLSRNILSEVRMAVSGMKKYSLFKTLNKLENELVTQGYNVTIDNTLPALTNGTESALVLMLTEAVTNILRHSNGNKVNISLNLTNETLSASITDNGKNITVAKGNGLKGITERCQQLQGTLAINTKQGFTLMIELPYKDTQ